MSGVIYDHPSKAFLGVRFVLLGFHSVDKDKFRSRLITGGAVDVGRYGPDCTHVIVDKLVYDDPVCVAARNEGKALVTALWVDHSFDVGMPVDANSIMYRPARDLSGISGAESLVICLTGYQRQDRDDIMTMVGLMGANFSKPLVANKVTHLICYKFEGEKYELAKKMKKIKLVNHQWLEDCLRAWEILPEVKYDKSGYELELEAEAKDSEDEEEDTTIYGGRNGIASPFNLQVNNRNLNHSPKLREEISRKDLNIDAFKSFIISNSNGEKSDVGKETSDQPLLLQHPKMLIHDEGCNDISCVEPSIMHGKASIPGEVGNFTCSTGSAKRSPHSDAMKPSDSSSSRKTCRRSTLAMHSGEVTSTTAVGGKFKANDDYIISSSKLLEGTDASYAKTPAREAVLCPEEGQSDLPSAKVENLASSTVNTERSPRSDAVKSSDISYSQKTCRRTTHAMPPGEVPSTTAVSDKFNAKDDFYSSKLQEEVTDFSHAKTPARDAVLHPGEAQSDLLSRKRKIDVSYVRSKSHKKTQISAKISGDMLVLERSEVVEPALMLSDQDGLTTHDTDTHNMVETTAVDPAQNSPVNITTLTPASSDGKPTEDSMPLSKRVTSNIQKDGGVKVSPQTTFVEFKEISLLSEVVTNTDKARLENAVNDVLEHQNKLQGAEPPSRSRELGIEKSDDPTNLLKGKVNSQLKPLRRKIPPKKSLGSGSRQGKGNVGNRKGSIYVNRSVEKEGTAYEKKGVDTEKLEMVPLADDVDITITTETDDDSKSTNEVGDKIASIDDETEAPEDEEEYEAEMVIKNEKLGPRKVEQKPEKVTAEKSEATFDGTYDKTPSLHDATLKSGEDKGATQAGRTVHAKKNVLTESKHLQNDEQKKMKGKKQPLHKRKQKSLSTLAKLGISKEVSNQEEAKVMKNTKKTYIMKEENVTHSVCELSCNTKKADNSMEIEKENNPIYSRDQNVEHIKQKARKADSECSKGPKKIDRTVDDQSLVKMKQLADVKAEPIWFILTGHKLQRKEFQEVIRGMKGRVCRDSHHWSYQATHFIVPDPIRRTEKVFAAAASGRWILRTEYLTASNQAGRFLAEVPYEWHNNGLSEDGAINLEAPRKWRLARERTGHGAFYQMRIIIYGECIAPPLDTLKRVVKAGDGTILATSPPYTRFLQSGVDFAIVSPGMPCVDMWVQEFLRHEIPCVVADYLVDYVCKPGYSLDKHVQYNTHAWAEKSFKKLVDQTEVIVENPMSPGEDSSNNDDLQCQVCGSRERGEVMLICGNESGTKGCGIGTHIDCCNPPLKEVPEGDWFCLDCSKNTKSKKSDRSLKRRTASKC